MQKNRILLVEDDDAMRLVLSKALARDGYDIVEASNGKMAVECLDRNPVDLVITDIIMPDSEGVELTLLLHNTQPELPVIAMSGGGHWGPEFHLTLARAAGAIQVLSKPFPPEMLLEKVHALLPLAP